VNIDGLRDKAKRGEITFQEVEQVADALRRNRYPLNTYALLYTIGRSYFREFEPLVASFLLRRRDIDLIRLALYILCDMWGERLKYREYIVQFAQKNKWDKRSDSWLRDTASRQLEDLYRDTEGRLDLAEERAKWGAILSSRSLEESGSST